MAKKPTRVTGAKTRFGYSKKQATGRAQTSSRRAPGAKAQLKEELMNVPKGQAASAANIMGGKIPSYHVTEIKTNKTPQTGRDIPLPKSKF